MTNAPKESAPPDTVPDESPESSDLQNAQAIFQQFVPKTSPSLADELIAERRAASDAE